MVYASFCHTQNDFWPMTIGHDVLCSAGNFGQRRVFHLSRAFRDCRRVSADSLFASINQLPWRVAREAQMIWPLCRRIYMLLLLLPCLLSPTRLSQIECVNGRTQHAFVSLGKKREKRGLCSCLCILSINQSSEIPSGAARNNTKLFCSIGFDIALKCASLPPPSSPLSFSLSCALIIEVQQPCEICLVICVAKMVCALKNGACHKWHSCGSKPNAENKQLLLNICTHTPHVPSPLFLSLSLHLLPVWVRSPPALPNRFVLKLNTLMARTMGSIGANGTPKRGPINCLWSRYANTTRKCSFQPLKLCATVVNQI